MKTVDKPTQTGLLKNIIQWLTIREMNKLKGACPGCEIDAPGQRSHMGFSGCLVDVEELYSLFGKDITVDSTRVYNMYTIIRQKLGLLPDPDAVIASTFASELYKNIGDDLLERDISFDFLFKIYARDE